MTRTTVNADTFDALLKALEELRVAVAGCVTRIESLQAATVAAVYEPIEEHCEAEPPADPVSEDRGPGADSLPPAVDRAAAAVGL